MKKLILPSAVVALALAVPAAGAEQSKTELQMIGQGRGLYLVHCAACHGTDLHGAAGAALLVPDLGLIAVRDHGFRRLHVRAHVAEGTAVPAGDHRRDGSMPCWQSVLSRRGARYDPARADRRILALVRYLEWAQQQPLPQDAALR